MNKREIFNAWLWMTLISVSVFAQWNPAVNLGPTINTSATEKASDISSDGKTLYFFHDNGVNDFDIYYCELDTITNIWGAPINIGTAINSTSKDVGPSLSIDGQRLYFASNRPGGYGSYDIYVSLKVSGVWQSAVNLGPIINSSNGELGQDISAGDSVLWFVRGWPEPSPTNEDIYYSRKVGGVWTTPVQWERNTIYLEDNPNISNDGNTLYFTAIYDKIYGGGYGSFDIWVSQRVNGVWQIPVNLGSGVNGAYHDANPSISADGNIMHFTSDRPSGYGGFDLYYSIRQTTSIENQQSGVAPAKFELYQNYPNPFNPATTIKFQVPSAAERHGAKGAHFGFVSLKVFDVLGKEVAMVVNGELSPGEHSVLFDANNLSSGVSASGVYFYRLSVDGKLITKKLILIR